jgi:hypothetical protein
MEDGGRRSIKRRLEGDIHEGRKEGRRNKKRTATGKNRRRIEENIKIQGDKKEKKRRGEKDETKGKWRRIMVL